MKRFLPILFLLALVLIALSASAQVSTTVVGNSSYTNSLIVKTSGEVKLYSVTVYNSGAATEFVQIFQTNAVPADGWKATFSYPVGPSQFLSYDFGFYGADLYGGCVIAISSTGDTLTIGDANAGIQAIIKH